MPLESVFSLASMTAVVGWLLLVILPKSPSLESHAGIVIPLILSAGYLALIAMHFQGADGGFGSLADVATLFRKPELLLAGWIHYLAFDLFIGAWEVRDAQRNQIPHLVVIPCLRDDVHARPDRAVVLLRHPHRETEDDAAGGRMIDELRHRDPLLFWIGALMVLALIVVTLLSIGDTRLILGLNPWVKPMKFLSSITIFLWTVAWFMPETQPERGIRLSRIDKRQIVRWTIGVAMAIEIALHHPAIRARHHLALQQPNRVRRDDLCGDGCDDWRQHPGDDAVPVDRAARYAA